MGVCHCEAVALLATVFYGETQVGAGSQAARG